MATRWKLSKLDLTKYALHGVQQMIGFNSGSPFLTEEQEEEWERVERELHRRIKILEKSDREQGILLGEIN